MATVRIDLPDQLAEQAERAGLLSSASLEQLLRQQLQAQAAYQRDIATRDRHELPQPVLIKNARVFDSEHAVLGAEQDVYVNHGRIGAVYPAG